MPLGTKVGLGPGHIVLDGDPGPFKKGALSPVLARVYCGQTVAHFSWCGALVQYQAKAWGTSPIWPILCRVGCKTTNQSISCELSWLL